MKLSHIFFLFFLFISFNSFSQDQIVLKDGSTIIPEKGSLGIVVIDKRVKYQLPGKKWLKYVAFSDLDYVSTNGMFLKSFKLNNPNKIKTDAKLKYAYFVLIETPKYKLLSMPIVVISGNFSHEHIYALIIDKDDNVVENLTFLNLNSRSEDKKRDVVLLRKYFGDLKPEMDALTATENEVAEFLKETQYRKYN